MRIRKETRALAKASYLVSYYSQVRNDKTLIRIDATSIEEVITDVIVF